MWSITGIILLFLPRPVNMMFCCRLSDGEKHRLFAEWMNKVCNLKEFEMHAGKKMDSFLAWQCLFIGQVQHELTGTKGKDLYLTVQTKINKMFCTGTPVLCASEDYNIHSTMLFQKMM